MRISVPQLNRTVQRIAPGTSARDTLELISAGEGVQLGKTRKTRKPRDRKIYNSAIVAVLCGVHVEKAIKTIAALMNHSKRENIKLKAATTLIELACELDVSAGNPVQATPRVYILAQAPQTIQLAADEARRRLAITADTVETEESKV